MSEENARYIREENGGASPSLPPVAQIFVTAFPDVTVNPVSVTSGRGWCCAGAQRA